jgi:hypothetical protein
MMFVFVEGMDALVVFPCKIEGRTGGYGWVVAYGTAVFSNVYVRKGYGGATG